MDEGRGQGYNGQGGTLRNVFGRLFGTPFQFTTFPFTGDMEGVLYIRTRGTRGTL